MSRSRQMTNVEIEVNEIFQCVRDLDKLTWSINDNNYIFICNDLEQLGDRCKLLSEHIQDGHYNEIDCERLK